MMTHHAILVEGTCPVNVAISGCTDDRVADVYIFSSTVVGIDEARRLVVEAQLTPQTGSHRLVVVEVQSLTIEAQNALLKLLEEPPRTTRFLFVVRPGVFLLPTLRSRFLVVSREAETDSLTAFADFLAMSLSSRLAIIAERIEKKDDEWLKEMRSGLQSYLTRTDSVKVVTSDLAILGLILSRLGTRGASPKMLLEELALSLPVGA